jgi:hypothetical protein
MYAQQGRGANASSIMSGLARFPGNVMGSPEDLLNLMTTARGAGAMFVPGAASSDSNRTRGFLNAVQQMQAITPATPVGQLGGAVAQQLQAQPQQTAAYLTGGAFAMLGGGGKVKSLQEWAEGILRWIEGLRPPPDTGKPFDYGQLMAQYFPGSNIDAWMSVNGITNEMKEYWWNYALGKASKSGSTQSAFSIQPLGRAAGNQPFERLQAVSAKGRGELQLGSQMAGSYANKEQSNRWFADLMGAVQRDVIPKQTARGGLASLQYMPDTLQELLMGFIERSGPLGALIGGGIGYGIHGGQSLLKNLMGFATEGMDMVSDADMTGIMDLISGGFRSGGGVVDAISQLIGDAPDIGDNGMEHGMHGATSTAGLHPDMKRKVGAMMKANPKLRINSGLRDTYTQENLKAKGYSRVSGKSSAHTRGLAADLGPSSQYKWISRNAKRFGLKSGKSFGEPWHVGIGDVGIGDEGDGPPEPISDPLDPHLPHQTWLDDKSYLWNTTTRKWEELASTADLNLGTSTGGANSGSDRTSWWDPYVDPTVVQMSAQAGAAAGAGAGAAGVPGIGRLFNLFNKGGDRDSTIDTIGSLVPSIMTLFLGAFGMADDADMSQLAFQPGLYDQLLKAGGGTGGGTLNFGGIQPKSTKTGSYDYAKSAGFRKPGASTTSASTATSSGARDLAGALAALGMNVPAGTDAGTMVAHLAHLAGFSNDEVATVVGISKRESGWRPDAYNGDAGTGDKSYGLMQINMLGSLGPARREQYGLSKDEDLFDPYTNLKVAYGMSGGGSNFNPWGGYKGKEDTYNTNMEEARRITRAAGYGDMPDFNTMAMLSDTQSSDPSAGGLVFHNQFIINAQGGSPTSGGFDVRRAVTQMADQLEAEMNKRSMRHN